jgi:hypothetical protein
MILFLLKNVVSGFITVGPQEIAIWIICGILIHHIDLFLKSHGFLQAKRKTIPIRRNPGHPLQNETILKDTDERILIFRPTWKSISRMMIFSIALALPLIVVGLWHRQDLVAVGLGCLFLVEFLIVRFRFQVVITEHWITSTTFFRPHSINRSEITDAFWYSGWIVLQSPENRIRINSTVYPIECRHTILSLLIGPDTASNSTSDSRNEVK